MALRPGLATGLPLSGNSLRELQTSERPWGLHPAGLLKRAPKPLQSQFETLCTSQLPGIVGKTQRDTLFRHIALGLLALDWILVFGQAPAQVCESNNRRRESVR